MPFQDHVRLWRLCYRFNSDTEWTIWEYFAQGSWSSMSQPWVSCLTLFWVRISSLSWSSSLNHFCDCGIEASEDISLFMSRMLTTAISSKLLLSNRLGLLNRLPPSIEMVTLSTPGALWVFSLLILWEISCSDTKAHILSSCDTGFVGLIIHSFHPWSSLAANSCISCSPQWEMMWDCLPDQIFSSSYGTICSILFLLEAAVREPELFSTLLTKLQNCLAVSLWWLDNLTLLCFLCLLSNPDSSLSDSSPGFALTSFLSFSSSPGPWNWSLSFPWFLCLLLLLPVCRPPVTFWRTYWSGLLSFLLQLGYMLFL